MKISFTLTLRKLSKKLSVRAGLFCMGAIIAALLAVKFSPFVPDNIADLLGGDAANRILTILASSMLAVVTFSLSTLIASYSVAGASAPARATELIMGDSGAQTALSTFLGAFIFSIVSLVALSTGYYGSKGRVILFGLTIFVLTAVIWTVIRWIGQLSEMGKLANVIAKIETASIHSIQNHSHLFECADAEPEPPADAVMIECDETGFIQTIDLNSLSNLLNGTSVEIWVEVHAGQFVYPHLPLARISGAKADVEQMSRILRKYFFIGHRRTFDDDPRFGLIVLSEVASRALSPGINDPGTAIEIIGSLLRLISKIQSVCSQKQKKWRTDKLHFKSITADEILDDAFQALSRDGASVVEVGIFLQKALGVISQYPRFSKSAYSHSLHSLKRNEDALINSKDMSRLIRASAWHKNLN